MATRRRLEMTLRYQAQSLILRLNLAATGLSDVPRHRFESLRSRAG
jgi:hypothetical protein